MDIEKLLSPKNDTIVHSASLQSALTQMAKEKIHYVVVLEADLPIGILTEKDIVELYHNGVEFSDAIYHYATKPLISVHQTRPIQFILSLMNDNAIKRMVVVNEHGHYVGTISLEDIIYLFEQELYSNHTLVNQMCTLSNQAQTLTLHATLNDALNLMAQHKVESVLIKDESAQVIGIVTQSDVLQLAKNHIDTQTNIKEFMHAPVVTIQYHSYIYDLINKMKSYKIRHVVTNDGEGNYYVLGMQEILHNFKGNYSNFLENKLKDTRDTFNNMDELVIEVIDFNEKQIISWINQSAKEKLALKIDTPIITLFKESIWQEIYTKLHNRGKYTQKVKLGQLVFNATFSKSDIFGTPIIKILLLDITQVESLNKQLLHNLEQNYQMTLQSLVELVESRDTYTGGHSQRVANYAKLIAQELALTHNECELVYQAGILHDIGKISTPDTVLLNPGRLSPLEYKLIQEHVKIGYSMLSKIPMYIPIANIIKYHHERYDGNGYPYGIKGEDIPLLSSILALADSFDAMTTNRIYRARRTKEEAIEEIVRAGEGQFNPHIISFAIHALQKVEIDQEVSQEPKSQMEKERFAYFYRDRLSNAYNEEYLNYLLSTNRFDHHFAYINVVYIHNFNDFNNKQSWQMGNRLLATIANYFIDCYPMALIVRIHGDDFALLSKEPLELDMHHFMTQAFFHKSNLGSSQFSIDLNKVAIHSLDEFEHYIRSQ
jgi:putative nucleotidyltransferase with HDIG domain